MYTSVTGSTVLHPESLLRTTCYLEHSGRKDFAGSVPEVVNNLGVLSCNLASHTKGVVKVEFISPGFSQNVASQVGGVTQTLERRIHEASVAEVGKAAKTSCRFSWRGRRVGTAVATSKCRRESC